MRIMILDNPFATGLWMAEDVVAAGHIALGTVTTASDALHLGRTLRPDLAILHLDLVDEPNAAEVSEALNGQWRIKCLFASRNRESGHSYTKFALGLIQTPVERGILREALDVVECIHEAKSFKGLPRELLLYHHRPRPVSLRRTHGGARQPVK